MRSCRCRDKPIRPDKRQGSPRKLIDQTRFGSTNPIRINREEQVPRCGGPIVITKVGSKDGFCWINWNKWRDLSVPGETVDEFRQGSPGNIELSGRQPGIVEVCKTEVSQEWSVPL